MLDVYVLRDLIGRDYDEDGGILSPKGILTRLSIQVASAGFTDTGRNIYASELGRDYDGGGDIFSPRGMLIRSSIQVAS
jgi:hypothetical protein